jgi:Phage integrase family
VLREHRAAQRAEQAAAGDSYCDSGYVFTSLTGDPLAPDRLSRSFRSLADVAGLPPVRLHDLRHDAASLALAAGADLKVVHDMLGHASIVLTADTYISVLPEVARKAAEDVATLLISAGCLVPGTGRRRPALGSVRRRDRRQPGRRSSRPPDQPPAPPPTSRPSPARPRRGCRATRRPYPGQPLPMPGADDNS